MKFTALLLALFCIEVCYGQHSVSGRVTDESGNPIPYASIISYKNKYQGIPADQNGNFKLDNITDNDTLICTHINYEPQKEIVLGNTRIIFQLRKTSIKNSPAYISMRAKEIPPQKNTPLEKEKEKKIFDKVELPARFGNGGNHLRQYIEQNLKLPDSLSLSFDQWGENTVSMVVHFIIDRDGKPTGVILLKALGEPFDQAVIDVISSMPAWSPAVQNGRFVPSDQEITIYFQAVKKVHSSMSP